MNIRRRSIILLAAMVVVPGAAANAQFGGLIKKAKQTITHDTTPTVKTDHASAVPVTNVAPVTSERLDAMLKGFTAQIPIYQQRATQVKLVKQLGDRRVALLDANKGAIESYQTRNNNWTSCMHVALQDAQQGHAGEIQAKTMQMMSDPSKAAAFVQDQQAAMQKSMALRNKGDTAGADAVMGDMMKKMGIDMHADTVVAERKCGAQPAKLGVMAQVDDLLKQEKAAEEQQRALERRAAEVGATAAGMSVQEFGLSRELQLRRLSSWLNSCHAGACGDRSITPAENALFQQRRADVEKILATQQQLDKLWNPDVS